MRNGPSRMLLIIICSVVFQFVHAQSEPLPVNSVVGHRLEEGYEVYYLSSDNAGNTYFLLIYGSAHYIAEFDTSLKMVQKYSVKTGLDGAKPFWSGMIRCRRNGEIYCLYTKDKGKNIELSALKINMREMKILPQVRVIDATGPRISHDLFYTPTVLMSPDSSLYAFVTRNQTDKENGKVAQFHASVFREDLSSVWNGDITLPYPNELWDVLAMCLRNDGTVALLEAIKPPGKHAYGAYFYDVVTDYSTLKWKIARANVHGVKEIELNLGAGDIFYPKISSADKAFVIAGVYGKGEGKNAKGIFSMKIGDDNQVKEATKPFPSGYFITDLGALNVKASAYYTDRFGWTMSSIFSLSNSGQVWNLELNIGDQSYKGRQDSYLYALNALVVYVDSNNTITQTIQVPKRQLFNTITEYPSGAIMHNDKLYLAYLDNPFNEGHTAMQYVINHPWIQTEGKPASIMVAEIKPDGTYQKGKVANAEVTNKDFVMSSLVRTGNADFMVWVNRHYGSGCSRPARFWITGK